MSTKTHYSRTELQNAVGFAAKQLCSLVCVSGFELEQAKSIYIDPVLSHFELDFTFDLSHRKVTVSCPGAYSATAEMRDGIGCTITTRLAKGSRLPEIKLPDVQRKPLPIASPKVIEKTFDQNAVEAALNRSFASSHKTLAVVILHKGKIIAEKYADGIAATTPLPGWSMAKSLAATFVGLLVKRGKYDIYQPGVVPEWRENTDGSERVSVDHLLRMTSGLDVVEDQSGADPNSRMIFVEPDAAAYAASRGGKFPPGTHWEYMSGNTILACRAIYEAVGSTLKSSQYFYREALLMPLGAASFVLETDIAGTFIGSSYALANAHDWAKFGQLYLDDGVWNGKRILPEGWVEYVTRHTPESGENSYGAGFWTVEHNNPAGLPADTFFANGFQGQYVIVIPSRSLVIVRLGASLGPDGIWQLVQDLVSAMH